MTDLETMVMQAAPADAPDLSGVMSAEDFTGPQDAAEAAEVFSEPELISPEVWGQQWGLLHDMLGGMVQARTGAPCPLGQQARSEGGMIAAQASYDLLALNPATARLFLGANSTFFGQVLAVGVHGFACVQLVKASIAQGQAATIEGEATEGPAFASSRAA